MRSNGGEDVFAFDSYFFGLDDELFDIRTQQLCAFGFPRFGKCCYNGADAGSSLEQSVSGERRNDLMCCVWIDL